jgi:hypothetical protein
VTVRLSVARAVNLVLVGLLIAMAVYAFGPTVEHRLLGKTPAGVATLQDIGQLSAAFNKDSGSPRLVLIFSPT